MIISVYAKRKVYSSAALDLDHIRCLHRIFFILLEAISVNIDGTYLVIWKRWLQLQVEICIF